MIKNYSKKINIKYFIKDFTKKINLKEIYDFVVLGEVIEHVYNPEKILKNLKKIIDKKVLYFCLLVQIVLRKIICIDLKTLKKLEVF